MRTARIGLIAAVLLMAGCPAAASASQAGFSGGFVQYFGGTGETNDVTVSYAPGGYTITEAPPETISAVPQCVQQGPNQVFCPDLGIPLQLRVSLGDMGDTFTLTTTSPGARIDGDNLLDPPAVDTITGGPGVEDVTGGGGNDIISTGGGDDRVEGGEGNDMIDGGPGNDSLEVIVGPGQFQGNDTVVGGTGDDTMRGGVLAGGLPDGGDSFTGGLGRDRIDYSVRTSPVNVTQDGAANDGQSGEGDNIGADVEVITGGGAGDVLVGAAIANLLEGGAGEDLLQGGAGNDSLDGGAGDAGGDTLEGGEGDDSAGGGPGDDLVRGGNGRDFLDGGSGSDTATGDAGDDSVLGGAGIDTVSGGAGNDNVRGGVPFSVGADGADVVKGDEGNDSLFGDDGDDTLNGGPGSDSLSGGAGTDTTDYAERFQDITVLLDGRANDGAPGEADNNGNDIENIRGGRLDDTLEGNAGSNLLQGGTGEDYADGGGQPDELLGGENGDVLRARDGLPDRIACGDGPDFVIADRRDRPEPDCDRVDNGTRRRPRLARTAVVRPRKGTLGFSPTRIRRTVPLKDVLNLPIGSRVDATKGSVRLTSARGRRRSQSAILTAGLFQVLQKRGRAAVTDLVLKGGSFRSCRPTVRGGASVAQRRRRVIRRLRANARGRFRTRGRHSAATVRGTKFEVIDRCDGTLTRVTRGTVLVRDFRRKKTIRLRAGRSHLARAR